MDYFPQKLAIISVALVLLTVKSAFATTLYFTPADGSFSEDSVLPVELKINSDDTPINTIEGQLKFSEDIFSLDSLSDGNSIISFWLKKPAAENGIVSFAGIIPGGYGAKGGTLIKIFLKPIKIGQGKIEVLSNTQVLLNDGQGTKAKITYSPALFNIIKNGIRFQTPKDTESPESFLPKVARDPAIFDGQWFLTFSTQDKNSGIGHYEVEEINKKQPQPDKWIPAESPYTLNDQNLKSYIYVKAVDRAGNERIIQLLPVNALKWYKNYFLWFIMTICALISYKALGRRFL